METAKKQKATVKDNNGVLKTKTYYWKDDFDFSMNISVKKIKEIAILSKKSISQLRKLNPERAYNGKDLTKYQLIYQIIFNMDAPSN